MQFLEDRVPIRPGQPVDRRDRALAVAGPVHRPGRKQRRRQIGDRTADRLGQIAARGGILLMLERVHAEHQLGDAIALVGLRNALGIFHGTFDIAIYQQRQEGTVEQIAVLRVALERGAVKGGGRAGIALLAGVAGGEIAPGSRHSGKVLRGRRLGGKLDRRCYQECGKRGAENAPGDTRRLHGRCSNEAAGRGLCANRRGWAENGLFAPPPQERRSRRADVRLKTPMWQYRGRAARRYHIFG